MPQVELKPNKSTEYYLTFRNGRYRWDIAHCRNCKATITAIDFQLMGIGGNYPLFNSSFSCCSEPDFHWTTHNILK